MTPGDLLTSDYQIEYEGIVIGQGDIEVTRIRGVLSSPEIRTNDNNRPLQDGVFPGNDYYGERVIVVDIEVWGQTPQEMADNIRKVMAVSTIRQRERPLVIRMPGWSDDLVIDARPRQRGGFDIERDMVLGYIARGSIMFVASNPRLVLGNGTAKKAAQLTLTGVNTNGLQFDIDGDFTFGGVSVDGSATIRNDGTADANLEFTIDGGITDPAIIATLPNGLVRTLALDTTIGDGDTVVLRTDIRSILFNTNINTYAALQDSSQWFDLPVGDTLIQFAGVPSGAVSPVLTVAWRDSYM